ncbi:MAG: hypothetical protein KC777_26895 [Cyanobacteria bacterium HKST-UBA02]|nr:hypothetical protein [Cyanobacteria bacterium HKST-UBA02]
MTEFLVPPASTSRLAAGYCAPAPPADREIDLKEALEWLLGSPENHDLEMSENERRARKERRLDLLIWLMNLELRLSPYSEPA